MGGVGPDLARWNTPPWRWKAGVAPRPHPFGAAKVGDAGVGADTRAREGNDMLTLGYPSSDRLDVLFEALFAGNPCHALDANRFANTSSPNWCSCWYGAPPLLLGAFCAMQRVNEPVKEHSPEHPNVRL